MKLLWLAASALAACSGGLSSPDGGTTSAGAGTASNGGGSTSAATSGTAGSAGGNTGSSSTSSGGGSTTAAIVSCAPGVVPDPCRSEGFACHLVGDGGRCEKPSELDPCRVDVGCATAATVCTLTNEGSAACVRPCSSNSDCPLLTSTCQAITRAGTSVCYFDFCGPTLAKPATAAFYGRCTATFPGDGTCLPVYGTEGALGVCLQGGTHDAGLGCLFDRPPADAGNGALCAPGYACEAATCRPLCAAAPGGNFADGGPGCGTGQTCALSPALEVGVCSGA